MDKRHFREKNGAVGVLLLAEWTWPIIFDIHGIHCMIAKMHKDQNTILLSRN